MASGSIAQVHKAALNGEMVAVKVRGVRRKRPVDGFLDAFRHSSLFCWAQSRNDRWPRRDENLVPTHGCRDDCVLARECVSHFVGSFLGTSRKLLESGSFLGTSRKLLESLFPKRMLCMHVYCYLTAIMGMLARVSLPLPCFFGEDKLLRLLRFNGASRTPIRFATFPIVSTDCADLLAVAVVCEVSPAAPPPQPPARFGWFYFRWHGCSVLL